MAGENQYSFVRGVGDIAYPPLSIRSADGAINLISKYIMLESYSENYKPDYKFEHVFGKVNPIPTYSTTDRTIQLTFTLAARNVHEAKNNLGYCRELARTPYGVYAVTGYDPLTNTVEHSYESQRRFIVDFGTFLRDQEVEIINFDFTINMEAGVFDYGSTPSRLPSAPVQRNIGERSDAHWEGFGGPSSLLQEDSYVYHGEPGKVFPKAVNIKIEMRAFHKVALGFGGEQRPQGSVGWSLNENLDWPHGTGPIPASRYCQRDVDSAPKNQAPNNGNINEDLIDEG